MNRICLVEPGVIPSSHAELLGRMPGVPVVARTGLVRFPKAAFATRL